VSQGRSQIFQELGGGSPRSSGLWPSIELAHGYRTADISVRARPQDRAVPGYSPRPYFLIPGPRRVFECQPFLSRQSCALGPLVNEADSSRNRVAFAQRAEGPMSRRMSTNTLLVMALQASSALDGRAGIDLYWLPLGAGGNFVRLNGRIYEAIKARLDRRPVFDLYHSGLQVFVPEGRYTIEQTPVVDGRGQERGVVAEGPVGARWAGRFRIFRYEMRRWRDGVIPDIDEAVDSPRRLSDDVADARRLLELAPQIPILAWGRDELRTGEMWNSNSIIAWLIARTGLDMDAIKPPPGGRAPGWNAGEVVAARERAAAPRLGASTSIRRTVPQPTPC
jgi:hypothetical protein